MTAGSRCHFTLDYVCRSASEFIRKRRAGKVGTIKTTMEKGRRVRVKWDNAKTVITYKANLIELEP